MLPDPCAQVETLQWVGTSSVQAARWGRAQAEAAWCSAQYSRTCAEGMRRHHGATKAAWPHCVVGHLSQLPARVQAGNYVKELIRIQIQGPHSSQRTVSFPTSLHRSSTIMAKNKKKDIVVRENQWHFSILSLSLSSFFFSF